MEIYARPSNEANINNVWKLRKPIHGLPAISRNKYIKLIEKLTDCIKGSSFGLRTDQ